jgi:hypothetical protein
LLQCSKKGIMLSMKPETDAYPAQLRSDDQSLSLSEEHNFEAIFQIPVTHQLVLVRSRSQGGLVLTENWEHDEYDSSGRLVARYSSFQQVSATSKGQCGWCKFDKDSERLSERDALS